MSEELHNANAQRSSSTAELDNAVNTIVISDTDEQPSFSKKRSQQTHHQQEKTPCIETSTFSVSPPHSLTPDSVEFLPPRPAPSPSIYRSQLYTPSSPNQNRFPFSYAGPRLHDQILAFFKFLQPTSEEKAMRKFIFDQICYVVHELWPQAKVNIFGSCSSELTLPTSDIDIVVSKTRPGPNPPMLWLSRALRQRRIGRDIQEIRHARVPIIKLNSEHFDCSVDISFNIQSGVQNTATVKQFLDQYEPVLRPLVIVLKYFLRQRSFNEPYNGGLGSYALILLVVSYLQHLPSPTSDLGELLIGFFQLYGTKFNYYATGISVAGNGSYFSKIDKDTFDWEQKQLLCIEDPSDRSNDVGRSAFEILTIRNAFAEAYTALEFATKHDDPQALGRIISIPSRLLEYRESIGKILAKLHVQVEKTKEMPIPLTPTVTKTKSPSFIVYDSDGDDSDTVPAPRTRTSPPLHNPREAKRPRIHREITALPVFQTNSSNAGGEVRQLRVVKYKR